MMIRHARRLSPRSNSFWGFSFYEMASVMVRLSIFHCPMNGSQWWLVYEAFIFIRWLPWWLCCEAFIVIRWLPVTVSRWGFHRYSLAPLMVMRWGFHRYSMALLMVMRWIFAPYEMISMIRSGSSLLWNGSIDDYVMRFYRDQGRRLFARPLAVLRFRWFVGHLRQSKRVANRDILYWLALFLRIHNFETIESYPSYYGLFHPPSCAECTLCGVVALWRKWRCGASGETNQQWT